MLLQIVYVPFFFVECGDALFVIPPGCLFANAFVATWGLGEAAVACIDGVVLQRLRAGAFSGPAD